jgi:Fur family ferric uptake transcriptional regulator
VELSCLETLKELGYRLTPQRLAVIEAVHEAEGHISAEELYAQVQRTYPEVNISTVYRTLQLLKRLGLVTETDMGEGILRYHHADEGHHHHLICQECGRIIDLDESVLDSLAGALLRKYGFVPDFKHLAIFGCCLGCQK